MAAEKNINGTLYPSFFLVDSNGNQIDFASNIGATSSIIAVPASVSSATILTAKSNRKGRPSVYYDGSAIMYLAMGTGASPTKYSVKLGAGLLTYWEAPIDNYTGLLSAVWSSDANAGSALITEIL